MIRHPLSRLLLVAALIVPMTGVFALEYTCEMDGNVHRSRCCEKKAQPESGRAELTKPDCCNLRPASDVPATKPAVRLAGDQAPVLAPVIGVVPTASLLVSRPLPADRDASATGPPIFLRNCSILC